MYTARIRRRSHTQPRAALLVALALLVLGLSTVASPPPGASDVTTPEPPTGLVTAVSRHRAATDSDAWVRRSGSELQLKNREFGMVGANIYWLQLDDNVRDAAGQPTYPTRFRIDDAMRTARVMGVNVIRTWANSVGCPRCLMPQRDRMNAKAFDSLDYAVASARRHNQRLILTLVDNWDYYHGGKLTYTRWRGAAESEFFSNPSIIGDYKRFITEVVSHVNPHTGLAYRDDPTIIGWETGNEMWCQTCAGNHWDTRWTREIAKHIRASAPRQLIIDGHGTDPACTSSCLHEDSLRIPEIDAVDDHHYPPSIARLENASRSAAAQGRAYLVGEYDWRNHRGGDSLQSFLAAVRRSPTAGAFMWSIIPHADTTGFVEHADGFEYYFPGRTPDERRRTQVMTDHARRTWGFDPRSAHYTPTAVGAAQARAHPQGVALRWRGSAGADHYVVQRRMRGSTSYVTVASRVRDTVVSRGPIWVDRSVAARRHGTRSEYRIYAVGSDGRRSPPTLFRPAS